jgi:DNA polymerase-1
MRKLSCREQSSWQSIVGGEEGTLINFYEKYWRPFGQVLISMEREGMHLDQEHLVQMQIMAEEQSKMAQQSFKKWAQQYCPDAASMNVGSDAQIRILLFGGKPNRCVIDFFLFG